MTQTPLQARKAAAEISTTRQQLEAVVAQAKCQVFGWEDAGNAAHRYVLTSVISTTQHELTTVLCEPSLTRSTTRPPDVVVVCPFAGVLVIEVKGIKLDDINAIEPGGQFAIQYRTGARSRNPFAQVRNAMFDIRDAAHRGLDGTLNIPFRYFVSLPNISRSAWKAKWGEAAMIPKELLFGPEVTILLGEATKIGKKRLESVGQTAWPVDELRAVHRAFGDSSVLSALPEERQPRRVREATLGEMFDEAAESYKTLSEEQQRLSAQYWETGPRLVRGVAGSGKTIVLANNLARRIQRSLNQEASLFHAEERRKPRFLVVCFNRTLVPLIEKKVDTAYRQRTGSSLPKDVVEFFNFNGLMYHLSKRGLWRYQKVFGESVGDAQRVEQYLNDLTYVKQNEPNTFLQGAYDAIYCDEGQDFTQEEFQLLKELCLPKEKEPSLFVFYDDAQNLYGCKRPHWQSLGLNVLGGRSSVMSDCFRNTQPIVDLAFNVLYGSFADTKAKAPSKAFGDVQTLIDKGLLAEKDGRYLVSFAKRTGLEPIVTLAKNEEAEAEHLLKRIRWLVEEQEVRIEDILVLSWRKERLQRLAEYINRAHVASIPSIHLAFQEKDDMLGQRRRLTLSTVNSAKGYDAYCVLLASANEFKPNVDGRAAFYVGCTRAIEYLEISGYADSGLLAEAKRWKPNRAVSGSTT